MSLEVSNKNIDTTKEQKRTGFADLKHTKTVNAKETVALKKTLILTNRKSVLTDSDNVFEVLFAEDPGEKENYMFIGRSGLLSPDDARNASYIELSVNSDISKPIQSGSGSAAVVNGRITMSLSHNKTNAPVNFDIVDAAVFGVPQGSVAAYMLASGANGVSGIGYDNNVNFYNLAKKLYLGSTLQPDTNNAYDIGTGALRIKTIYTVNAVDVSSDIRFKKNVKKLKYGLKEVKKINPISYTRDGQKHLGFSAQELRKILPEVVSGNLKTALGIRPDEIVPVLFSAVKELSNRLDVALSVIADISRSNRRRLSKSGGLNSINNRKSAVTTSRNRIVVYKKKQGKKGDKRFKK